MFAASLTSFDFPDKTTKVAAHYWDLRSYGFAKSCLRKSVPIALVKIRPKSEFVINKLNIKLVLNTINLFHY